MEKQMFVSLFLERTVRAVCPKVSSLELRLFESKEIYMKIELKEAPPILFPVTNKSNLEIAIATLEALKRIGG